MKEKLEKLTKEVEAFDTQVAEEIEQFRIKFLGRKGLFNELFEEFKTVPHTQKKELGQLLNQLKTSVQNKVEALKKKANTPKEKSENDLDLTLPESQLPLGSRHPVSLAKERVIEIFEKIGFSVATGPEMEDDWHNFTALNLPDHHPARDMQDTFFLDEQKEYLLRTHTSNIQIRHMAQHQPPIRILAPGRVYRNETVSTRSHCMFHQIEGLFVDKKVSFADLKQIIQFFVKELFGKSEIRLRASYFPFTEPSAEVDVYWGIETESDHRITKGTGWLEIMGCGMVNPNVLRNVDINPDEYSGYAFGMGIERIAMLLYQITDIRDYYKNDVRFLQHFR